ncbi:hypothetical protein GTP44_07525 [Duganella sp. FT50W]|uniref:Uncharacterized protein n=1 Tax=Duganella lactea TaxID=2692173 RepID=A0A6L8MFR7_9BURK|nr:hypothetical protein [Duganella lactea]MYM81807.1 hypothetical protein [Duganella lactea]
MMDDEDLTRLLSAAPRDEREPKLTAEQEVANANVMTRLRRESAAALQLRIESKEFLPLCEFSEALKISVQSIDDAVMDGRMFAISDPAGEEFYPAFYADRSLSRDQLETVAKALVGVPATSKFHFFTSKSTFLGETPLEALVQGRLEDVLTAAAGFRQR